MITYPIVFFGGAGASKIREDFENYSLGDLPVYTQLWQHSAHQWIPAKVPNKYLGITWKDYGVSGAFEDFASYSAGTIATASLKGQGNIDLGNFSGVDTAFYRDSDGLLSSADRTAHYSTIFFDWGINSPLAGYKSQQWGAKFIGLITPEVSGNFRFWVERNDYCRIYIGQEDGPNNLVFDKWNTPAPTGGKESSNYFFMSSTNTIIVEYYQDVGNSKLKLYWEGPNFPITALLPQDFGLPPSQRVFIATRENDVSAEEIRFDGKYQLGVINTNYFESATNKFSISGFYAYGIVWTDYAKDFGKEEVSHAGYHVYKNVLSNHLDNGANLVNDNGYYVYKNVFSSGRDLAGIEASQAGYHVYKNVDHFNIDFSKSELANRGFYAPANAYQDVTRHTVRHGLDMFGTNLTHVVYSNGVDKINTIGDILGIYYGKYSYNKCLDNSANRLSSDGTYIYAYGFNKSSDYSLSHLNVGGNYISRFLSASASEAAYGILSSNGEYRFGFKEAQNLSVGKTEAYINGEYLTRYISYKDFDSSVLLGYVNGTYSYGINIVDYKDCSTNLVGSSGEYYESVTRFLGRSYAVNKASLVGGYLGAYTYEKSLSVGTLGVVHGGIYYRNGLEFGLLDSSQICLYVDGDITFSRIGVGISEAQFLGVEFTDSVYIPRGVPCYQNSIGFNGMYFVGEYLKSLYSFPDMGAIRFDFSEEYIAYSDKQDYSSVTCSVSASFVLNTSSLEYWVDPHKSDPYNLSVANKYFNL